jgi:universal stress protein A
MTGLQEHAMTPRISRVLVPTDFSAASDEALAYARTLAEGFGASLYLLHVVEDFSLNGGWISESYLGVGPEARATVMADARERLAHRISRRDHELLHARSEIIVGATADTIASYADSLCIDLIVMGTHGRTGFAHILLGSVAEKVVRTAPCPVLTVHAPAVGHDDASDGHAEAVPSE